MVMKLEQIHYLVEINRLQSISAAARSLRVRQTTLSAIVRTVEEEVGFAIFQRMPQGVVATPAGEHFLSLAWEIHVKYEELLAMKRRITGGAPVINVPMSHSISARLAIPLSERFYKFDVHGNLFFEELPSEEVGQRILDNTANLGLANLTEGDILRIRQDYKKDSLVIERLLEDELCIMVSRQHRFADRETVDIRELLGERRANLGGRKRDKVLGSATSRSGLLTSFASVDDMYQAVIQQNIVGFAPRFIGEGVLEEDDLAARLIPLRNTENENRMYVCLLTCKDRKLRYQENIIVSCIRDYFRTLREQSGAAAEGGEEQ